LRHKHIDDEAAFACGKKGIRLLHIWGCEVGRACIYVTWHEKNCDIIAYDLSCKLINYFYMYFL